MKKDSHLESLLTNHTECGIMASSRGPSEEKREKRIPIFKKGLNPSELQLLLALEVGTGRGGEARRSFWLSAEEKA